MVAMHALLMTSEPDHLEHNLEQMCQKKKGISAKKPDRRKRAGERQKKTQT